MPSSLPCHIHLRFCKALTIVGSIPPDEIGLQPVPTDKLKFYGLYKQATRGECNIPKPSSRKVLEYAKWKAWNRVRHVSCMEAQNLYVNALIELLVEFIHRYPYSPHVKFAKDSLQSLELDMYAGPDNEDEEANSFYSPALEESLPSGEVNALTYIEPHQRRTYCSPQPSSSTDSSMSPILSVNAFMSHPSMEQNSPNTPILSPRQSYFSNQHKYATASSMTTDTAFDVITPTTPLLSMTDLNQTTAEKSNASNLKSPSPTCSPSPLSLSLPSSTTKTKSMKSCKAHNNHAVNQKIAKSSRDKQVHQSHKILEGTLETLQTEVSALSEQIDRLRRNLQQNNVMKRQYPIRWLIGALIKHFLANTIVVGFILWIMIKKRSPIALALVDYFTPQVRAKLRAIVYTTANYVMFWKVTV